MGRLGGEGGRLVLRLSQNMADIPSPAVRSVTGLKGFL